MLGNKGEDPPVLAIAEDGSAVVPLLGGLQGVNDLARQIAQVLQVSAAITASGEIRFRTTLLSPPPGYRLLNDPDQAKGFIAEVLAGATVRFETHPSPSQEEFAGVVGTESFTLVSGGRTPAGCFDPDRF